jgi:hypothetical protein
MIELNIIRHNYGKMSHRHLDIFIRESHRYKFLTVETFAANVDVGGAKEGLGNMS